MGKEYKLFVLGCLIPDIHNGKAFNDGDLMQADSEYSIAYITRTDSHNGIKKYIANDNLEGVEAPNAITIGDTTCTIFYQRTSFVVGPHIIVLRADWMNEKRCEYIISLLNAARDKYPVFARAFTKDLISKTEIPLPIQQNEDGTPVIDPGKIYSEDGYIPDWQFIERYVESLDGDVSSIPDYFLNEGYNRACWYMDNIDQDKFESEYAGIKGKKNVELKVDSWRTFHLYDLFYIDSGNKFDKSKMSETILSEVAFVGRSSENNGVSTFVDKVDGVIPYQKGLITLALGGSIGSCFIQRDDFYTSQNVAVLIPKSDYSESVKLFLCSLIYYETKTSYIAFARELNAHIKTDFVFRLPIQQNGDGTPVIDPDKVYSEDGYIPNWKFMEDYIGSLPFSCNL